MRPAHASGPQEAGSSATGQADRRWSIAVWGSAASACNTLCLTILKVTRYFLNFLLTFLLFAKASQVTTSAPDQSERLRRLELASPSVLLRLGLGALSACRSRHAAI